MKLRRPEFIKIKTTDSKTAYIRLSSICYIDCESLPCYIIVNETALLVMRDEARRIMEALEIR